MFNMARKLIKRLHRVSTPSQAPVASDENLPGLLCQEFDEYFEILTADGRQYRFNKENTATDDYLFF
jgi:hypothetical protein